MFHVKHGVSTTNQLFHVKRRMGGLSYGGMVFENCFHPIVVEELVFHVEPENSRKFFLTVGGMRFDFSVGHEAYSAAGKTHPQKQVENQKENAI